jgi:3-deoxy-manno-octulosonate cytidylyltransferase (CMP-KDO synthetase)
MSDESDFKVVIPARFASTRLPGKPLQPIGAKPMIEHVWRRAQESGAREVVVATDDERIAQAVRQFGGRALMTAPEHASGTDRLAEVARVLRWPPETIVVNLQGDEPMLPGRLVARAAALLRAHPDAGIATLAAPISDPADAFNPNVVKVVLDRRQFALYFSRAPIPWLRGHFALGRLPGELPAEAPLLRHVGLYSYRVAALSLLAGSPATALERAEALEQLRALWLGIGIFVEVTRDELGRGVDTAEDLAEAERAMLALGLA